MKHRLCLIKFIIVLICSMVSFSNAIADNMAGQCNDKITWEVSKKGVLSINGEMAMPNYSTSQTPPWYRYKDKITAIEVSDGITTIGSYSFADLEKVKSAKLPDSIGSIRENAFYRCFKLSTLNVPAGLTSIGNQAFDNCRAIKKITIPDSVSTIGENAFNCCMALQEVVLPSKIKKIESWTFYACKKLTKVTIPEGTKSLGYAAFGDCSALTTVTIPQSLTQIDEYAFGQCKKIKTVIYSGTEEEASKIKFGLYNDKFMAAKWKYTAE